MSILRVGGVKTLSDLDFAARIINTDVSVSVGTGGDYESLSDAINAFRDYYISRNGSLVINVLGEVITHTTTAVVENPTFNRAQIRGVAPIDISLTSVASTTGSSGAWDQVLNVSSTTGLFVGAYLLVKTLTGGSSPQRLLGCHRITAINSGTQLTVRNRNKHTSVASGAVTGTMRCLRSVLNGSVSGLYVLSRLGSPSLCGLTNVVFARTGGGGLGVSAMAGGELYCQSYPGSSENPNIGVDGYDWGFHGQDNGSLQLCQSTAAMVCASGCTWGGFSAHRASYVMAYHGGVASGCTYGFAADMSMVMAGADAAGNGARATGNTYSLHAWAGALVRAYNMNTNDPVTATGNLTVNTYNQGVNSFIEQS